MSKVQTLTINVPKFKFIRIIKISGQVINIFSKIQNFLNKMFNAKIICVLRYQMHSLSIDFVK
jgi:hypothetical protein